jgi:ABC-type Fe3+/spermidine/putrescine transport system ATPase subunit
MRLEIRALQRQLKLTILYVTHDQSEAMTLSDRIAVIHRGRFEQMGSPAEVYDAPATPFVAEFLGRTVSLEGKIAKNGVSCRIDLVNNKGRIALRNDRGSLFNDGEPVCVMTRPEDIEILPKRRTRKQSDSRADPASGLPWRSFRISCSACPGYFRFTGEQKTTLFRRHRSAAQL